MTRRAPAIWGRFSRDGKGIFFVSDRDGEFRELMLYDLQSKAVRSLTKGVPYDVDGASEDDDEDEDSPVIYTWLNVRGKHELRAFDGKTLKPIEVRASPTTAPSARSAPAANRMRSCSTW